MNPVLSPVLRRLLLAAPLLLAGCGWLGIESPEQIAAQREADGRAIGAGCRHAARSVEACYEMNKRADKAAIFAGWKEMHEYMAENKIEAVPPAPPPAPTAESDDAEAAEPARKSAAGKDAGKDSAKDDDKVAARPGS